MLVVLGLLTFLTLLHASYAGTRAHAMLDLKRSMVSSLGLTDLCLFTEARYTRHPSQADLHSAFQDHPLALEHFPSGSLLSPPDTLTNHYGRMDP
jgi:hypothetical protein